jgi:hypothetical protein
LQKRRLEVLGQSAPRRAKGWYWTTTGRSESGATTIHFLQEDAPDVIGQAIAH